MSLPNLETLPLSDNKIESLENTTISSSLRFLWLQRNSITSLQPLSFENNQCSLTAIYLTGNPLKTISQEAFTSCNTLHTLDLSYTQITRLPLALSDLTSLKVLQLHDNQDLVCTCEEGSALRSWFARVEPYTSGRCGYTDVDVTDFLTVLAEKCPT